MTEAQKQTLKMLEAYGNVEVSEGIESDKGALPIEVSMLEESNGSCVGWLELDGHINWVA